MLTHTVCFLAWVRSAKRVEEYMFTPYFKRVHLGPIYTRTKWVRLRLRTEFVLKKVFRSHAFGSINVSFHTRPLDPLETL